ncbi:MAG: HAD family hydrolase, partial [Candidatus Omnitrophota bacterium]
LKNDIKTMPGLKSAFPTLKNYKLAIVTEESRDLTDAKLEALGLAKNFQIILTSDDIGAMKPDERYYKKAFARLKVLPSECLVVGDSYHKDLAIPKKLGAAVVCIGESREADYSIKSYRSFLRILGRI